MVKKKENSHIQTLNFVDSYIFMSSKLSDFVDNVPGIYDKECIFYRKEKVKSKCELISFKNNRLYYKFEVCKKRCNKLIKEATKKFSILYQFCKADLNKVFLLLRKGVYPDEDMDSWEKFDKTTIPPKETFYSKLNEEGISNEDYVHVQKVW